MMTDYTSVPTNLFDELLRTLWRPVLSPFCLFFAHSILTQACCCFHLTCLRSPPCLRPSPDRQVVATHRPRPSPALRRPRTYLYIRRPFYSLGHPLPPRPPSCHRSYRRARRARLRPICSLSPSLRPIPQSRRRILQCLSSHHRAPLYSAYQPQRLSS